MKTDSVLKCSLLENGYPQGPQKGRLFVVFALFTMPKDVFIAVVLTTVFFLARIGLRDNLIELYLKPVSKEMRKLYLYKDETKRKS